MPDEADLLPIIERIYDAATAAEGFGSLAADIAWRFGSGGGLVYTVLKPGAVNKDLLSATAHFDDHAHVTYTAYYQRRDVLSLRAVREAVPLIAINHELMEPEDFRRTEIYEDYFRRIEAYHMLIGMFPLQDELFGVVCLQRPERELGFAPEDKRRLGLLVPHLQRAVQIRRRLCASEQDRALTLDVLDRLALGAIVVDAEARVVFANTLAERLLRGGHGLTLSRGRLRLSSHEPDNDLQRLVREATQTASGAGVGAGGVVALAGPDTAPRSLLVSPFRALEVSGAAPRPTALVMFSDPAVRTRIPEQVLARTLGLAPAEARLLAALVEGRTMADYTDDARITLNTAKTQLRQIFLKTGHNRQSDLIRAVLSDPVMRMACAPDREGPLH